MAEVNVPPMITVRPLSDFPGWASAAIWCGERRGLNILEDGGVRYYTDSMGDFGVMDPPAPPPVAPVMQCQGEYRPPVTVRSMASFDGDDEGTLLWLKQAPGEHVLDYGSGFNTWWEDRVQAVTPGWSIWAEVQRQVTPEAESSVTKAARMLGITSPEMTEALRRALEAENPLIVAIDGRVYPVREPAGWCMFEAMGNRVVAGEVWRTPEAGWLVRIPLPDGGAVAQVYGAAALYCLTPCSEEEAREFLGVRTGMLPTMVNARWHKARLAAGEVPTASGGQHGDDDDDVIPF